MELIYDWRAFEKVFSRLNGKVEGHRVARGQSAKKRVHENAVFVLLDKNRIVQAYSPTLVEPGLLQSLTNKTLEEAGEILKDADLFWVEKKAMHDAYSNSLAEPHFFAQTQSLTKQLTTDLRPFGKQRRRSLREHLEKQGHLHFFLQSALGSWRRFFPQAYGVYIRLDASSRPQHIFVQILSGKITGFYEPEFQGLPVDRRQPEDLVRYLGEKHGIKVLGFYAAATDWWNWSEAKNPWAAFYAAFRLKKLKIVPASLAFKSWLAAQATLGKA